jgi:hypothetical protein
VKVVVDSTATRDKQNSGVWTEYGGSRFLVGHLGNIRFQRVLTRLQAPHRQKVQRGTLDPADARKIMCKAMSLGIVHDWADVVNSKGEDVAFSPEVCEEMLLNNDDVREFLAEFSQDLANYKEEQTQEEGKS